MNKQALYPSFKELFREFNGKPFRENILASFDRIYGRNSRPWKRIVSTLHDEYGLPYTPEEWRNQQSNIDQLTAGDQYYVAMTFWLYVNRDDPKIGQKCQTELTYVLESLWGHSLEEQCKLTGIPGALKLEVDADNKLGSKISVLFVGSINEAIDQIYSKREQVKEIRNTHIVSKDDVFYGEEQANKLKAIFSHVVCNNNGAMTDIFGGVEDGRNLPKHTEIAKSILDKNTDRYHPMTAPQIKPVLPFINFTILEFFDNEKEIYFGWGGVENDLTGDVFWTKDNRLIEVYERIFRALKRESEAFSAH